METGLNHKENFLAVMGESWGGVKRRELHSITLSTQFRRMDIDFPRGFCILFTLNKNFRYSFHFEYHLDHSSRALLLL